MIVLNKKRNNKVDFLFIYESKVREIESVCLIASELERRGYSVGIENTWPSYLYGQFVRPGCDVVFVPSVYSDRSLYILLEKIGSSAKVINLQWEQIYSRRDLTNPKSPWKMTGDVKRITHISWGDVNYKKLTETDNINSELVKKVGHVGMDFLRPELRTFYLTRDELCREYGIDNNTKLCLFISSFSFINLPENMIEPELRELFQVSGKSQKTILEWFVRLLEYRNDITIIYRPHPAEADNTELKRISDQNVRFKIIKDYSVKQWILVSDIIYNWYSTSLGEVYFAGKSCYFLRPFPIPAEYECLIMEGLSSLTTYDEFIRSIDTEEIEFPVSVENITENYTYDSDCPTYLKIADIAEELLGKKEGYLKKKRSVKEWLANYKLVLKTSGIGKTINRLRGKRSMDPQDREYLEYLEQMNRNNKYTEEEIFSMMQRINESLAGRAEGSEIA